MNVDLVPYTQVDGIPTMSDSYLMDLFIRCREEGSDEFVFYDGPMDPVGFVNMCKTPGNHVFLITVDGEPGGFVWLNGWKEYTATAHFCFFKSIRGNGKAVDVGRGTIKWLFENMELEAMYGMTPETYKPVLLFIRAIGMNILGTLPKGAWIYKDQKHHGVVLSYVTREEVLNDGRR